MNYIAASGITDCYPVEHDYWLLTPGCAPQYNNCKLNYKILGTIQDPFNKSDELYDGYNKITNISDTLISLLSQRLNKIHNLEYSEKYWRIHIGIWALHYVNVVYDRYIRLSSAKNTLNTITVIGDNYAYSDIQKDSHDFHISVTRDSFNLKICTKISEKLNIPIEYVQHYVDTVGSNAEKAPPKRNIVLNFLRSIKNLIFVVIAKISSKKSIVICQGSYLPAWFQLTLFLSTLGKIGIVNDVTKDLKIDDSINYSARSSLSLVPDNTDTLTALIISLVGEYIPKVFVEGYDRLSSDSQRVYDKYTPKVIYSSNLFWYDELFKHWSALCQENGIKLVGGTHGGGAFLYRYKLHEDFEISIADYYITWGWKSSSKHLPLPAHKLISFYNSRKKSRDGYTQILYVTTIFSRHNISSLEDHSLYFEWQKRFLNNIPDLIEKNILIRPHFSEYGWGLKEGLLNINNTLRFDNHEYSFHSRIRKSRVCVYDYISTTFAESLAMNIPTIVFQSSDIYPIIEEMVPNFESLRKVSIFHDTPESAMKWLDSVYDRIDEWWLSDDCQNAVSKFCNVYAKRDTVKNSLSTWSTLTTICD